MASTISAGTTSGTAIAIAGDTTGALALQTNGTTTAVTIDTSQNVGIGTSSPSLKLDVIGAIRINEDGAGTKVIQVRSNWAGVDPAINVQTNNPLLFNTNGTERMRIDSAGRLIVGGTSAVQGARIESVGNTNGDALALRGRSADDYSNLLFIANAAVTEYARISALNTSTLIFGTGSSGTERMRIDSSGRVGIGVTPNTANRLEVKGADSTSGTQSLYCTNSNGTAQLFLRNDNFFNSGAIANYSLSGTALVIDAGNYVGKTTSSLRYKKDIVDYDKGLDAIAKLRPVYYKSAIEGPHGFDPKQHAGFIAEEIADEGFEEFLVRNLDGEPDAVQYAQMTALLCKAIQELKAELDATKAEVQALKGVA